jgi:hypothetical protein
MNREEFEKWWHGDDTSRHPTNSYEGAMRWAYEGWVRGATAEREACAIICDVEADEFGGDEYMWSDACQHCADFIRARGGE